MEKIYNLPVDKIPLSTEEKDVFQWLFPAKEKEKQTEQENVNDPSKITIPTTKVSSTSIQNRRKYQYYGNIICAFLLMFCAVYPKWNFIWKKFVPTDENSIIFSSVKVFTIFFILYLLNYVFHKYK